MIVVLLIAAILLILPASTLAGPTVIKFAHVDPEDVFISKKGALARAFKDIVEVETGGAIQVNLFPAGQLGGEREILESTKMGTIQMCAVSGVIGGYFKPAMVLDIPYLFSSPAVAWKVLDGEFGEELSAAILKKTGMRNLAYGETGFRNFCNFVRPIKSPADLKDLKIRVMETPLYVTLVKSLGAAPTPIAWTEVYSALQQKVVDGLELPVSVIIQVKMYEVLKYLCLDAHTYSADFLLINDKFFQKLDPEYQAIIKRAAIVAGNCGRAIQQLNSAMGVSTLKEKGMEIYSPNSEERAQFKEAAQGPVIKWMETQIGGPEWINKVQKAVKKAESELAAQ
jgi:tripartite ATP-independent transporter DctP family solute receptor